MKTLTLFFLIIGLANKAHATAKVCVLNFERYESAITKVVQRAYKDAPHVTVKVMATPLDILGCVKNRSTEIVIIAHALETPASLESHGPVNLAYFRNLSGEERHLKFTTATDKISAEIQRLREAPQDRKTERRIKELEKMRRAYQNYPAEKHYYEINPILPHAFKLARQELNKQADTPEGVALQEIRLMFCLPKQVLSRYHDLTSMIDEHALLLDIAPKNKIMSFIERKTVTSPNVKWLRESIPTED